MKKFALTISTVLFGLLLSFSLAGCVGGLSPSADASSSGLRSSAPSSATVQQTSSQPPSSQGSSSPDVAADDGSYAQRHLVGEAYAPPDISVEKAGEYTDKDHVALYIREFGTVPSNYVSKTKARNAGWINTKGNLWDVLPGKSIGGGGFYNDDNMMPDAFGREWFECDIDYEGGFRNAKRIVYSNDGLIYYTDDHYNTFQRLY